MTGEEPEPPDWIKKTGIGSHHSRRAKTVVWLTPPEIPRALGPSALVAYDEPNAAALARSGLRGRIIRP